MLFALGVIIITMTPTMLGEALAPVAHTRRGRAPAAVPRPDAHQLLPLLQATAIMLVSAAVLLLLAAMTSVVFF
jgi:hypothetical protein